MLVSKSHLSVRHGASKDASRYNLNGVRFEADGSTVATNGHLLMRTRIEPQSSEEYPSWDGFSAQSDATLEPFTLPLDTADSLAKAVKANEKTRSARTMPILSNAALDVAATNANGKARFGVTDLESGQVIEGRKVEGDFPNYHQVIPAPEKFTRSVHVNAGYLATILKAASEFGHHGAIKLELQDDPMSPIRLSVHNPDIGDFEAILMPMRV